MASCQYPNREETWRGYGIESGTNETVYLAGSSPEDIRLQANGRAYRVKLLQVWQVEAAE